MDGIHMRMRRAFAQNERHGASVLLRFVSVFSEILMTVKTHILYYDFAGSQARYRHLRTY